MNLSRKHESGKSTKNNNFVFPFFRAFVIKKIVAAKANITIRKGKIKDATSIGTY
jgi:hypothetical protein